MDGTIIGAPSFESITFRFGLKSFLIHINPKDVPKVKEEFRVDAPNQLVKQRMQLDLIANKIFAVHKGEKSIDKERGIQCSYIIA